MHKFNILIHLFLGNKNLKSSDIEVLALNICDINGHESALNNIIAKFGKVNTYYVMLLWSFITLYFDYTLNQF